ncbi:hypothetical protein [Hymenobacter algoricola]|uniref:Uncharacterized protein n=1 Tax=Hymenobacter algoricola TaxID=486267 RepID=A0ABP7MS65_9BACT
MRTVVLLLLLGAGVPAPAQPPILQTLEFLRSIGPAAAPAPTGPARVVFAIGSVGKAGRTRPGVRARLQLSGPADSVTLRVVASHTGLGTATATVARRAATHGVELYFQSAAAPAVGGADLTLRWEYRAPAGNWVSFATTRHRLYWVLSAPGLPWGGPREEELWAATLAVSCRAAAGARTPEEAASAVTRFVYGSRDEASQRTKFQYNPMLPDANLTHLDAAAGQYVVRTEDLQALLASLNNPAMAHLQLNCYDAAGCVMLLSNALGCRLRRVKVNSAYYLVTRKLIPMGFTKPAKADFRVHCVAWSGPLDERGLVYDACFALPPAPAAAPATPLAALPFGSSQHPGSYAERVFTNKEAFYLTPLPALVIRPAAVP